MKNLLSLAVILLFYVLAELKAEASTTQYTNSIFSTTGVETSESLRSTSVTTYEQPLSTSSATTMQSDRTDVTTMPTSKPGTMPQFSTSGTSVSTTQVHQGTTIPYWTTRAPVRLHSVDARSNERGTVELNVGIYNRWRYDNITYEVSYWLHTEVNDTSTVTTTSEAIVLTNLEAYGTYYMSVTAIYDGTDNDTIQMNFTDICVSDPCQNNASCIAMVTKYFDGYQSDNYECDCRDGFIGHICQTELFISLELVEITTTTITIRWFLTNETHWWRFEDYLVIDLISGEIATSRRYERYTHYETTFDGLRPGTSYTVTVSAIQYWTHGLNTSDSLLVNLAPEPPVFADVIYHNTTSVFVYWYPGCTDYDTFEVTYVCEDSPFALTENVTYPNITILDLPSNSTCFIDIETISNGLRSATKYPLQIKTPPDHCASSPCGINGTNCRSHIDGYLCTCPSEPGEDLTTAYENVFSSTVLYTTPAYTLDINLDVVDFGSRRINVTWSITEHPWYSWIDYNFEITYESCAVESTQCHECYSIEMDGLLPGTLYVVHVKAIDIYDSRTTTSNSLLVRTVPESPVNVSVWYLTSSSFEVRADFPDDMNGQDIEITYWPMNEANNSRTVKDSIINGINSSETYALSVVAVSGELKSEPYLLYTTDHCVSDPCHGEASCQSTHDLFICRCPIDRKGDRCQYGMLLLEDLRAESNGHGTIELTVYVDNSWGYRNISYVVSYWKYPDVNNSVTVSSYSTYITLTNVTESTMYSLSVVVIYDDLISNTLELNFSDLCNITQCNLNGLCTTSVYKNYHGYFDEGFYCNCFAGFVGSTCENELFITIELVEITSTTITIRWFLTNETHWWRFEDYLVIDLIGSEIATSRRYERYTHYEKTFDGLRPGTSYTVTVSAIQRYWTVSFNTSDSVLVNLAPESPVFADVIYHNTTSVFVYWNPGCTDYDTFEVTYVCEGAPLESTENVTYPNITLFDLPTNSTCFIDIETISNGLRSETKYQLQINTPPDHCASSPCGIDGTNCRSHIDGYLCTCPSEPGEDVTTTGENLFSSTVLYTTPVDVKDTIRLTSGYKVIHVTEEEQIRNPVFDVSSLLTIPNAAQRYDLLPNAASSTFLLDNLSGKVNATIDKFDYEEKDRYELEIDIVDLEGATRVLLIIVVENINDNRPNFTNTLYESTIMEYAPLGSLVAVVTAIDGDVDAMLTYSMSSQDSYLTSLFSIGQDGKIVTEGTVNLRRLKNGGYLNDGKLLIPVSVTDGFTTSSSAVLLTVEPLFVRDIEKNETSYEVAVPENATVGTFVANVSLLDPKNDDIKFKYRISVGRPDDFEFTINVTTGIISTRLPLDREQQDIYEFSVIVLDNQCLTGIEILLEITIEDVNDEIPTFGEPSYSASIREDAGSLSERTQVIINASIQAIDRDVGLNAKIRYSITGTGSESFAIDPKNGMVWLQPNPDLDYESVKEYQLTVVARDRDGADQGNSNSVPFTVEITDANDNSPVFTNTEQLQNLTISEDSPIGTILTTIQATDADEGFNSELRFYIHEGGDGKFRVNYTTGELSLRSELDRETKDKYILGIIARDQGYPARETLVNVSVTVLDVNDNSPRFDQQFYNGRTLEGQMGSTILTVIASDPDFGENAEIEYSLTDPSNFTIGSDGVISATFALDRERVPSYDLVVIATDGGKPSRSSSSTVRILVDDVNDNEPNFSSQKYDATMLLPPGGITAGTLVSFVSATDLDSGSNAEITYSVISEKFKDTFQISPNGAITVIEDYIPVPGVDDEILRFNISAKDGGSPPKEDTGMVVITFEKPSQVYEFNETRYEFLVLENEDSISVGTVVAFSRIENKGLFYELPYAIDEVVLDRQTGSVNITRPIDREATSKLTFNVLARGDDLLDGFAFTLVEIIIQDVNDEAPYFVHPQEPVLWTELPENSVNSSFVKFKAEDRDQEGPNSQIVYSIVDGNDDDIFLINDSTGDLSVIRGADRESVESYNMIIMAKDKGFPSLNGTVAFNVLVLDENDNAPLIRAESTIVTLNENTGTGIEVSYVAANDEDKGKNAEITFQLEEDSNGMFYVNEISGSIQTAQSLDRETEDTHTIKVIAVDGGTPEKTSTPVFITFVVEDYNDNAPEFVNPNYYVPLPKDSPPKTKVLMVSAVDRDIGINAVVTYDIIGGGNCSQNHFEINSTTGQILTADTLYSQPSGSCLLSIRCQDTGAEPLSSTTMIEINIEEVNFPPRFLSDSYWATVNEHSLIGTAVNTEPLNPPTATDDDIDANGEVFYDIVGGNDDELFSLDHLTGQINVNKPLDRETLASVELIISAHDVTPDPKSATVTLTITISDANDNAPELPQELNATITQGGSSGDTVTIVNARDPDLGKNTECFYHIARARFEGIGSVTPSDYFNINQTDGAITTTDNLYKLNLTSTISIELILVVRNIEPIVQGPYSATNVNPAASWLTVSFQYKYTPRCRKDEYLIDVPEDMQIGESLNITVEPRQNGTKPLPSLFYEMKSSSSLNVFTIDVNTGEISVNNILDVGLYNLTIVVMTGDPENGKGSCTVLVDVYQVITTVHTTMTPAPVEPCTEGYLLALIGVSAATIVLLIVLIAVCLTLHWRTRGKDNGAKTSSKSAKLSEADEVQSVCELPQRPNWMLMQTLPESENGEFLKSDPTEEIFTNKYIEMSIHPRAADYQQVEGAQPESGVYETTVQDNTDVDDDYLRPVHTQGTMSWLPDVDYD